MPTSIRNIVVCYMLMITVEQPGEHVGGLGVVGEEVVDSPPLLKPVDWVRLQGSDHLREPDPVSDEEDGEI